MSGELFARGSHGGVGQDKAPQKRYTAASGQPETAAAGAGDRQEGDRAHRVHGSEKRRTEHVSSRILPQERLELGRIAKANNWSESKTVAAAIREFIQNDLSERHALRVAAVVTDAIDRAIERHTGRNANLSLQGYFAAEQSRILGIHVLRFLLGEAIDELPLIIEECRKQAWRNLKHQAGPVDGEEERGAAWQS